MSPRSNRKTNAWSAVNFTKHVTLMSCKLEPMIWSRDTGRWITCFDRCQLIIAGMSNIKEVHGKPRLFVSFNLFFGVWLPCCATPSPLSSSCVRAHEKILHGFPFLSHDDYGAPLGGPSGRWSYAIINKFSVYTIPPCPIDENQ